MCLENNRVAEEWSKTYRKKYTIIRLFLQKVEDLPMTYLLQELTDRLSQTEGLKASAGNIY